MPGINGITAPGHKKRNNASMNDNWLLLTDIPNITPEGITTRFSVPGSSPWFSGHFPGFPILPGIAQIYLAFTAVQEIEMRKGRQVVLDEIKRVRFKRMITPDERIDLAVAPDPRDENRYVFNISVENELASSGSFIIKEKR